MCTNEALSGWLFDATPSHQIEGKVFDTQIPPKTQTIFRLKTFSEQISFTTKQQHRLRESFVIFFFSLSISFLFFLRMQTNHFPEPIQTAVRRQNRSYRVRCAETRRLATTTV